MKLNNKVYDVIFQSTPPRGGRQLNVDRAAVSMWISIHAPREGGD